MKNKLPLILRLLSPSCGNSTASNTSEELQKTEAAKEKWRDPHWEEEDLPLQKSSRKQLLADRLSDPKESPMMKKKRFDPARLPWNARKKSRKTDSSTLSPTAVGTEAHTSSILCTIEILEAIHADIKCARANLLISLDAPQFPESQWKKLLNGGTADFDQVLSGIYASTDVKRMTEHISGLEFSFVSTTPSKRVVDYGDWITAFNSFAEAFMFIFPHRGDQLLSTAESLHTTPLSAHELDNSTTYSIPISSSFKTSRFDSSSVLLQASQERPRNLSNWECPLLEESENRVKHHATTSITACAPGWLSPVTTPTSAQSVKQKGMWRGVSLLWHDATEDDLLPAKEFLAETTLAMCPVPTPLANELSNATMLTTIAEHPHLFPIVMPVNVDRLEDLLHEHPNHNLVQSVCWSLRQGFWPWAETANHSYPATYDNAEGYRTLTNPAHLAFMRQQCAAEAAAGRFSQPFGPDLLPGMYVVPVWVVPQPHSTGLRLVIDHSAGRYSLNSMIPKAECTVHLDGLQQLGEALIAVRIRQTVVLDAERCMDFDNDFGGGGSGRVWSIFFALVLWITTFIKFILDLFAYVDDSFSWDFADNLVLYEPYQDWYLAKQVTLLQLWDELGIPHEKRKQEWGSSLTIIGLLVNAADMTIMMPDQSRHDLIAALRAFAVPKHRRPLVEFQRLSGWVNWALNVYVLLCPGLNTLYAKIRNKSQPWQSLWVSKALCGELLWIANHLETSMGVHMLKSHKWTSADADVVIFTDACPSGMSFYVPALNLGFQCSTDDV
ncbi:hypothetical protein FISHEDRAFT_72026 [Fistulina hepatica ATCC 64428]|uniref:Uncharacterized protein n=1 Tax=Fistulina hepatica ATCC 64428 TaxID=1128425 RepID=A0A0D7AFL6_9AGAR|nr:hypothetical protein FISHEDRAFT_72026 [Fistulina hepatica ATCC 64428]